MMNLSIPETWQTTKLAELAIYVLGGDWGKDVGFESPDYTTALCVRGAEFRNWDEDKGSTASPRKIKKSSLANRVLKDGDILVEISGGGPDQPVGRTVLIDKVALSHAPELPKICTNFVRLLRTTNEIDSRFLNSYLTFFYASGEIRDYQAGSNNLRNLKFNDYLGIDIPIAPFPEQHRIVAKIEELFSELDKGIENLKTAQAQLKVYRQALLKHAFEGKLTAAWREQQQANGKLSSVDEALRSIDPIPRPNRWNSRSKDTIVGHAALAVGNPGTPLPDGWCWVPMVDIARMESGHTPSRNHPEWWGGDIPWISIPDARKNHRGIITETVQMTNPLGIANSAARLLPASTVCVSRTASVGYVVELGKPMATSQDFVNWTPSEVVRPEWLRLVFGADREALLKFAKGTTHQTIYFPEWLSVHIGLPPIEEQKQIIDEVESRLSVLEKTEQTIASSLQQAEALRQSILKRAFSGQLVKQDAKDEPASVLLERIRAEKANAMAKPHKPKQAATDPDPLPSNVIPFPLRLAGISPTDLHAGILARAFQHHAHDKSHLVHFGHVKIEKIAHLVEAHLGIDLERAPIKDAAGPNDYQRLLFVESRARKANWFDVRKKKDGDAYEFSKKRGFDALLLKTMQALGERADEVDALIRLLLPMNKQQVEIVATLYAAWNNLLLLGQSPGDEEIVYEARENWHEDKLKIERKRFFTALEWMRRHGLVPAGNGRYVDVKTKRKTTRKPS